MHVKKLKVARQSNRYTDAGLTSAFTRLNVGGSGLSALDQPVPRAMDQHESWIRFSRRLSPHRD
jgi:hypothetical protein